MTMLHTSRDGSPSAKDQIDRLIQADAVDVGARLSPTNTTQVAFKNARTAKKHSLHVLDLRKQYMIQKYQLDTIQKPRRSFIRSRHGVTWHTPQRHTTQVD